MSAVQIALALVPLVLLVVVVVVMTSYLKRHPERRNAIRLWSEIGGAVAVTMIMAQYVAHHR